MFRNGLNGFGKPQQQVLGKFILSVKTKQNAETKEMPTVLAGGVRRHNNDKQLLVPGWSSNTFFTESFLLVEKN